MGATRLDALAAKLRRPVHALAALADLSEADLAALEQLVDEARERQNRDIAKALRRAFPQPLRSLILGRLKR